MTGLWKGGLLAAALWLPLPVQAQEAVPAADYSIDANWLCRPGRDDACAHDLTSTSIAADGTVTREAFVPATDPAVDCFYVYPTVSTDPGGNSDLVAGREETFVAQVQFARFGAQCRTFAPLYRQATLTSLHARMGGRAGPVADRDLAYGDVLAAWRHYMAHDNKGRGVVLIGHSQGAAVLLALIQAEIDGKPVQKQLVSAILPGTNIVVPKGADVGASLKHIPACRAADQTGCVISYAAFRDTAPPSDSSLFGRGVEPTTMRAFPDARGLCTNPASLAGGPAPLDSYFQTDLGPWADAGFAWTRNGQHIDTPFVSMPGMLSAQCVTTADGSYLAVHIHAAPDDVRTHDIPGDVVVNGRRFSDWGLHRIDMHLAIGDLVGIVGRQGAAYVAAQR
ncbi:DUF3089 domain-containing protein [Niveispirillum fermenti]|uniref:DUF3089 domain-containing protein n=1 Tax=Niveispirillum fermenti TaxID=1233113 RepID=UPI003A86177A